jgi:hypothetical protein
MGVKNFPGKRWQIVYGSYEGVEKFAVKADILFSQDCRHSCHKNQGAAR